MAFVTAAVTLSVQVLVHRVVSAKLLSNYAFLVIALTMLGFALSGVALSRLQQRVLRRRADWIGGACAFFVLTLFSACLVFGRAASSWESPQDRLELLLDLSRRLPLALPFAVPFAFSGFILGTLLSSPDRRARRVYAFDLVGSALGAFLVIGAISAIGVETALLASAGLLLVAGVVLFSPRSPTARISVAAAALMLAAGMTQPQWVFALRYPKQSLLGLTQEPGSGYVLEHTEWDGVAHIEVVRLPGLPDHAFGYRSLVGGNPAFHARFRRVITQNNNAFTYAVDYDGTHQSLHGIEETIYAAAYEAGSVARPRSFVIGVGGGFDVLTALHYDAREVVAVEVNAATVRILRETYRREFAPWVQDPRVRLVVGEGRHHLERSQGVYDVLQLSGVDSYSGTAAAAHVFSESYLYTGEAFDLYLSRLSGQGILNMMRLERSPPREMLRVLVTAVAALRRAGVERPERQIVMVTSAEGNFSALLLKKTPFTDEETARIEAWTGRSRGLLHVSASPRRNERRENLYQAFLAMTPVQQRAFPLVYAYDVRAVGDDRPFFFKYSRWRDVLRGECLPVVEFSLLVLLAVVSLAALFCVAVPLLVLHGHGLRARQPLRQTVFFGGLGLGFMAIEMALLQKLGLFLGHPNHALSIVLAALLLSSGIGAYASAWLTARVGGLRFVAYLLSGVILTEYVLVLPRLGQWTDWPMVARIATAFALLAPAGTLLGTFFPVGLERLKASAPSFVPWAWGINGIFSVLGPVLSVAVSTTFGMNALLLTAIPIYLLAAFAAPEPAPA